MNESKRLFFGHGNSACTTSPPRRVSPDRGTWHRACEVGAIHDWSRGLGVSIALLGHTHPTIDPTPAMEVTSGAAALRGHHTSLDAIDVTRQCQSILLGMGHRQDFVPLCPHAETKVMSCTDATGRIDDSEMLASLELAFEHGRTSRGKS